MVNPCRGEVWRVNLEPAGIWRLATYGIGFIFSFTAFAVLYTLVPSRNRNLANALPGAFVAALLFETAKYIFGFYVTNFRNFDIVFGSLGAIATFMFWVYVCSQIMLIGAEVSVVYSQLKVRKVKQPRFKGFGVPFHVKVVRAVRKLFLREPEKRTEP